MDGNFQRSARHERFSVERFDRNDPDPWLALFLDTSLPIDEDAKAALLSGQESYARRFLLPALRPFVFVFFVFVQIARRVFLRWPNMPKTLHRLIAWGLKRFATPGTNLLILRHFHIGSEILAFIKANAGPVEIESHPLRPQTIADLKENVFLQHDLNIYNFIIELNASLRAQGRDLAPPERLDFSMITDGPFALEDFPDGRMNFVDVQTAIELYTPLYALFLPRNDFGAQEVCRTIVETEVLRMGYYIYGWRHVPVNIDVLGEKANATRPEIEQILISNARGVDEETFERLEHVDRVIRRSHPRDLLVAHVHLQRLDEIPHAGKGNDQGKRGAPQPRELVKVAPEHPRPPAALKFEEAAPPSFVEKKRQKDRSQKK